MHRAVMIVAILVAPLTAAAQTSSAAVEQARANLQHVQAEIPQAMADVRRRSDQAQADRDTFSGKAAEMERDLWRGTPPPQATQQSPTQAMDK